MLPYCGQIDQIDQIDELKKFFSLNLGLLHRRFSFYLIDFFIYSIVLMLKKKKSILN